MAGKIGDMADRMLNGEAAPSKMMIAALDTMANLQLSTIKMGKELGVFMDAGQQALAQGAGSGGQVTIVVQTNVPMPGKQEIEVHQQKQREKNEQLLAQYEQRRDKEEEEK